MANVNHFPVIVKRVADRTDVDPNFTMPAHGHLSIDGQYQSRSFSPGALGGVSSEAQWHKTPLSPGPMAAAHRHPVALAASITPADATPLDRAEGHTRAIFGLTYTGSKARIGYS